MYAITGVTGHVGGAAAHELLSAAEPVRAVVRDPDQAPAWSQRGAQVAVANFADRAALTAAFAGCAGAFVLLPTISTGDDTDHRRLADSIAAAVAASAVPHVVALSSAGADLTEGTGPIRWLHHLETRLGDTRSVVTAIRSPHFQEKVEELLDAAIGAGVYPVFGDSADEPIPMAATRDIGAAVAHFLTSPPASSQVVDLEAPSYTERQVAEQLAAALGRQLQVQTIPRPGWLEALTAAGVPARLAAELAEMHVADQRGLLRPRGDRRYQVTTPLGETLARIVADRALPDAVTT